MKKIVALLLGAIMVFSLAACGEATTGEADGSDVTTLAGLFDQGYTVYMSATNGVDTVNVILSSEDGDSYYEFYASLSSNELDTYDGLDIMDDDYDDQLKDFLLAITDYTLGDINDQIPTQEELDAYIGLTIGDLEAQGFEQYGYSWSEGSGELTYDNGTVTLVFAIADTQGITDPDSATPEQLSALVITGASFSGISSCFFD